MKSGPVFKRRFLEWNEKGSKGISFLELLMRDFEKIYIELSIIEYELLQSEKVDLFV